MKQSLLFTLTHIKPSLSSFSNLVHYVSLLHNPVTLMSATLPLTSISEDHQVDGDHLCVMLPYLDYVNHGNKESSFVVNAPEIHLELRCPCP